jgi:hypothetical protein
VDQTDPRNPELVAFAERLTAAWKACGHPSRAAAAIAAKTTGGYFARLCAGTVEPGITIVARLATAFDIDAGLLAFGTVARSAAEQKRLDRWKGGGRPTERRARKVK